MFLHTKSFAHLCVTTIVTLTRLTTIVAVSPLPPCVVRCINAGLTSVYCTYPDPISCFCGNPTFVPNVEQCLQSCTPPEQQAAVVALNSACGVGTRSGVYSFPPITPISTTSSSRTLVSTNSPLPSPVTQPPSSSATSTQLPTSSSTSTTTPASAETKAQLRLEGVIFGAAVIIGTIVWQTLLR